MKSVSSIIDACHETARVAIKGCPADTYAHMSKLLEDALSLAPNMNKDYAIAIQGIVSNLLDAQEKGDLLKIADFVNFELVYVLENFQN